LVWRVKWSFKSFRSHVMGFLHQWQTKFKELLWFSQILLLKSKQSQGCYTTSASKLSKKAQQTFTKLKIQLRKKNIKYISTTIHINQWAIRIHSWQPKSLTKECECSHNNLVHSPTNSLVSKQNSNGWIDKESRCNKNEFDQWI